eukprot:6179407-Pyramimonas_sp.AAC.1
MLPENCQGNAARLPRSFCALPSFALYRRWFMRYVVCAFARESGGGGGDVSLAFGGGRSALPVAPSPPGPVAGGGPFGPPAAPRPAGAFAGGGLFAGGGPF